MNNKPTQRAEPQYLMMNVYFSIDMGHGNTSWKLILFVVCRYFHNM